MSGLLDLDSVAHRKPLRGIGDEGGRIVFLDREDPDFADHDSRHEVVRRLGIRVTVWDAGRGCFRSVDLRDRCDPLWDTANELAKLRS